jgi:hypothetical protein
MAPLTPFMSVIIACLAKSGHGPDAIKELADGLQRISLEGPDLVERDDKALAAREAGEIERLWFQCYLVLKSWGHLRISAVTGRFHIGHGSHSYPLFPRLFQVWPPKGRE